MQDLGGIFNEYPSEHSNHSQRDIHPETRNDAHSDTVKTGNKAIKYLLFLGEFYKADA